MASISCHAARCILSLACLFNKFGWVALVPCRALLSQPTVTLRANTRSITRVMLRHLALTAGLRIVASNLTATLRFRPSCSFVFFTLCLLLGVPEALDLHLPPYTEASVESLDHDRGTNLDSLSFRLLSCQVATHVLLDNCCFL